MSEEQVSALLGRPLTPTESSNFDLYLEVANRELEDLICSPLEHGTETRVFDTREGYSTVFVDIFSELDEVVIDGETVDSSEYSARQWNRRNGDWYNSIVFKDRFSCDGEVEVTAAWGFESTSGDDSDLPYDLQSVLAGLFALISKKNKFDGTVQRKEVEDFVITFNANADLDSEFKAKYSAILNRYSLCNIGNIQHGRVC